MITFGELIRRAMAEKGWDDDGVAEKMTALGRSTKGRSVRSWRDGTRHPRPAQLYTACTILGISPEKALLALAAGDE